MTSKTIAMSNYLGLPKRLPQPEDDGGANHLKGQRLPAVSLQATNHSLPERNGQSPVLAISSAERCELRISKSVELTNV